MSAQGLSITFVGALQVIAIIAAYQLGRQTATPEKNWPKGGIMQFGWKAWRIPLFVIVGVAAMVTIFLPMLTGDGSGGGGFLSGLFSGSGGGGDYRRGYGRAY